jgi:translation initiation factor 1A
MFAVVTQMLGNMRVRLQCNDGKERMGRIPGRMKYRNWIQQDDVVLIQPWSWQDEKADIEWRYTGQDVAQLRAEGHID